MINYLDKIKYLYPDINNVIFWHTKYNGDQWDDPYDGIEWNNKNIEKPTKEKLDSLDDTIVKEELTKRAEIFRKKNRDEEAKKNLTLIAGFNETKKANENLTFTDYLDSLEETSQSL